MSNNMTTDTRIKVIPGGQLDVEATSTIKTVHIKRCRQRLIREGQVEAGAKLLAALAGDPHSHDAHPFHLIRLDLYLILISAGQEAVFLQSTVSLCYHAPPALSIHVERYKYAPRSSCGEPCFPLAFATPCFPKRTNP